MNRISSNDRDGSKFKRGTEAENCFIKSIIGKKIGGSKIIDAILSKHLINGTNLDKDKGIDCFLLLEDNRKIPIQIKSIKKQRKIYFENSIPLEYKNINGGTGSLFKESILFAIEYINHFKIFRTKDLQHLFLKLVNINSKVYPSQSPGLWNIKTGYPYYTLITRCEYNRDHDNRPNEDQFAFFKRIDIETYPFITCTKVISN